MSTIFSLWMVKLLFVNFRRLCHTFSSDKICNYVNILCPGDLIYSIFLLIELFKDRLFYALRTVYFKSIFLLKNMTVYFPLMTVYFKTVYFPPEPYILQGSYIFKNCIFTGCIDHADSKNSTGLKLCLNYSVWKIEISENHSFLNKMPYIF